MTGLGTDEADGRRTWLAVAVGALLLAIYAALTAYRCGIEANPRTYQLAYLAGFCGYLLLVWAIGRGGTKGPPGAWSWWLAGCVLIRLLLLWTAPGDDVHRYLWEGRVQAAGFNPYLLAPDDDRLAFLRTADFNGINHPDHAAIYPAVAQLGFAFVARLTPSVQAVKAWHVLCDVGVVALLGACLVQRGRSPHRAATYGLCPLVLSAVAVEGHVDSVMLLFVVAGLFTLGIGRPATAGVLWGLAVAAKPVAVVLWPWLAWHQRRAFGAALAVLVMVHLPYLDAGWRPIENLLRFTGGGSFFSLAGTFGITQFDTSVSRGLAGTILVAWLCVAAWRCRDPLAYSLQAMTAVLLLAPIVHYWYFTWVLLFLPFSLQIRWLAASLAMVGYFEAMAVERTTGRWEMPLWVPMVVWTTFLAAWVVEAAANRWLRRATAVRPAQAGRGNAS